LRGTTEGGVTRESIEVALIRSDGPGFEKVPEDVINKYIPRK
jgi:hypothetical protein